MAYANDGLVTALTNLGGSDRFVFDAPGFGDDTITDFEDGDVIDMRGSGATFASLTVADDGSGNTLISTADSSTITLSGVAANTIDQGDFLF